MPTWQWILIAAAIIVVIVLVVLLSLATVFMTVQAFRGQLHATVWVCCGGLTSSVELIGSLVGLIVSAISEAAN